MKLSELKDLLNTSGESDLQLVLPTGKPIPVSFHITEVGRVEKTFIDCGGEMRRSESCQLQVWLGEDAGHRLGAPKAAAILEKARSFLPDDSLPVEIEYEDQVISQYVIESGERRGHSVVLRLGLKHTDCLAREVCGLPAASAQPCCGPSGCC